MLRPSGSAVQRVRLIAQHLARPPRLAASSAAASPLQPLLARALSTSPQAAQSSQQNSSNSSSAPSAAWTFTTSAAFHGKPTHRARRSGPHREDQGSDAARQPHAVEQGFGPEHPMCRWRDEQLALGKAPKEVGAGHDWYFVEGIPASAGTSPAPRGTRGVAMGVADGVGGWEDSGVDPSHFAQALMWFARERVRTQGWSWPDAEAARNGDSLKALLDGAFEDVTRDKGVVAGSSTACLAALDAETGMLYAANLGDSGFLVLRPHPVDALPPTPPASPTTPEGEKDPSAPEAPPEPTTTYAVVHAQEPQVHFFNAPRQLSKIPQAELDRAAGEGKGEGNWLVDRPGDADTVAVQLQDGDVVMLFTDGYSDNVWPQGETDRLLELVRARVDLSPSASTSRATADKELAASVAQTAVTFARMLAVRPDVYTPFAAESKRWGVKGMERGGKVDDVTVLVAVVRREAESAESAAAV